MLLVVLFSLVLAASAAVVPDRYLVVLKPDNLAHRRVGAARKAYNFGGFNGYVTTLNAVDVETLKADETVRGSLF